MWFAERGVREFRHRVVPFDQIMEAVIAGDADAGLLIHEGQLLYEKAGLKSPVNLGEWWHARTGGLPLPLGCNAVRKELGDAMMRKLARVLRESIRVSLEHRDEALRHSLQWARGMEVPLADEFVGMYVNDLTLDYGERGREAIRRFLADAHSLGLIPEPVAMEFISPDA
jgi:1,4-dihydroxy-6-naphthoate synthase